MKLLTIIAAFLISFNAFGQDTLTTKVASKTNQTLLGFNVSLDYCYRTLKNYDGSSYYTSLIEVRNEIDEFKFNPSAGINLCYNFSKKFGIEFGVQYSNKEFGTKKGDLIIDSTGAGTIHPLNTDPNSDKIKFIYNYAYLDVPLRAIFSFGKNKLRFVTSLGVTTNFLLKASYTVIIYNNFGGSDQWSNDEKDRFKSVSISSTLSLGIDYQFNNQFILRAEPTFRYGISKINNTPIATYLWNVGLNITCYLLLD